MAADKQIVLSKEDVAVLDEAGINWKDLLESLRNSPVLKMIIQQLLDSFFKVRGKKGASGGSVTTNMPKMKGHECCHKECCFQVLQSALCTAHCAAEHYVQCCHEEDHCEG